MPTRRNVLRIIGGGVVVAAASGGAFVAVNGPSQAAREPWEQAGQYDEFRKRALSFALLAPNPHNRQPWLVSLDGEDGVTLYCDLERRLPATDPYDRQITIGCGAFLELLTMAAAQEGYTSEVRLFPDGEDMTTLDKRPVAQVKFSKASVQADPLFGFVMDRRSNREVYEARDVPKAALEQLAATGQSHGASAAAIGNTQMAEHLRDLTWRAYEVEMMTPVTLRESVDLMRIGASEVAANPDGISLEGPMFSALKLAGAMTRETLDDPNSPAFRQGMDVYHEMAMSARAFGWVSNANATRSDQINAGRAYVRLNLKATELGLAIHPWSQALQEYAEMAGLYDEVHGLLGEGQRVQMLFRIGYAKSILPAPRRGLAGHLVET